MEPWSEIWLNFHTDSETVAKQKEPMIWAKQIEPWEARLAGNTEYAEQRLASAQQLAAVRGYRYLSVEKVADLPLRELLARIETAKAQGKAPQESAALMGGVTIPPPATGLVLHAPWPTLFPPLTLAIAESQACNFRSSNSAERQVRRGG